MNWYKVAIEGREVSITPEGFVAMMRKEKWALARNTSISSQTQLMFFTQEYEGKEDALQKLARNESIALATQRLFFTESYGNKVEILENLAHNRGIHPEVQPLFFTEE